MEKYFGGVDCGGTTFLCVIGNSPSNIQASRSIPTSPDPKKTIAKVAHFFEENAARYNISAIGLACFGPIDLNPDSGTWGQIRKPPKSGWDNTRPVELLRNHMGDIPIGIQTDAGGAAMAELRWGAGVGCRHMTYVSVGTGIGGAHIVNGCLMNGHTHSELGHMVIRKHPNDNFQGVCGANHIDCLEGLASGTAIGASNRIKAKDIQHTDPVFDYVAYYLGQMCANVFFCNAPERIVLGGGVMRNTKLIDKIRQHTREFIGGYLAWPSPEKMEEAIVLSRWLDDSDSSCEKSHEINAGALGGFLIADAALRVT
ncbi:MAG: ROK family protein [Erythrobacter sp.]